MHMYVRDGRTQVLGFLPDCSVFVCVNVFLHKLDWALTLKMNRVFFSLVKTDHWSVLFPTCSPTYRSWKLIYAYKRLSWVLRTWVQPQYMQCSCVSGDMCVSCPLSCWMVVNWGSLFFPSPGKTCQYVDLAGGSAVSSSTSCSFCCSSSSPLPPSSSTPWTNSMSPGLWKVSGSEFEIDVNFCDPAAHLLHLRFHQLTSLLFHTEPCHYPVLPNPPAVGVFSAPALHRLLLSLLWVPLDQVLTSYQPQLSSLLSNWNACPLLLQTDLSCAASFFISVFFLFIFLLFWLSLLLSVTLPALILGRLS